MVTKTRQLSLLEAWIALAEKNIVLGRYGVWGGEGLCGQLINLPVSRLTKLHVRRQLKAYRKLNGGFGFGLEGVYTWPCSGSGHLQRAQFCLVQAARLAKKGRT